MTAVRSSSNPSAAGMSMREKSAWICLITTVAVYVPYFTRIGSLLGQGKFHASTVVGTFIGAVVIQIILTALAACFFMFGQRREPRDERDTALEARAYRYSYWVLAVACFSLLLSAPVVCLSPRETRTDGEFIVLLATQALLLCFVVAEVTRYAILALGYRRGF